MWVNLTDTLLDPGWYWLAWFVWLAFFGRAVLRAPWRRLQDSEQLNVWLGMIVLLILVWCLEAGVRPGLGMHLLGATIFTLTFGPSLAFIGLSLVMAGVALNGSAGLLVFAINALFTAGVGVVLSQSLYRLFLVVFPRHFFIYIFIDGFLVAALSIIGVGISIAIVLALAGAYSWEYLSGEYLPYFLLLGFAEAWLSGMVMTVFVVYRPQWVMTFDDSSYLVNK